MGDASIRQPEAVIFCGLQASGKSSFYIKHFFKTHVHISLDQLRTRAREKAFLETCLKTGQSFAVDNTNPGPDERRPYISAAKERGFKIIGYYFSSKFEQAAARNSQRAGREKVPVAALKSTLSKLQRPDYSEGFDELFYVNAENGHFIISGWQNEL